MAQTPPPQKPRRLRHPGSPREVGSPAFPAFLGPEDFPCLFTVYWPFAMENGSAALTYLSLPLETEGGHPSCGPPFLSIIPLMGIREAASEEPPRKGARLLPGRWPFASLGGRGLPSKRSSGGDPAKVLPTRGCPSRGFRQAAGGGIPEAPQCSRGRG